MTWSSIPNGGGGGAPGSPASVLGANTLLVAQSSNATDNRSGLDKYDHARPFLTIQAALDAAVDSDSVHILRGTYVEDITTDKGAVGTPLKVRSEGATIDGFWRTSSGGVIELKDVKVHPETVSSNYAVRVDGGGTMSLTGCNVVNVKDSGEGHTSSTVALWQNNGAIIFLDGCNISATSIGVGTGIEKVTAVLHQGAGTISARNTQFFVQTTSLLLDAACVWMDDVDGGLTDFIGCLWDTLVLSMPAGSREFALIRCEGTTDRIVRISGGEWRHTALSNTGTANFMIAHVPSGTAEVNVHSLLVADAFGGFDGVMYSASADVAGAIVKLIDVLFGSFATFPDPFTGGAALGDVIKNAWNSAGDLCLGAPGAAIQMTDALGTKTEDITLTNGGGSLTFT